MGSELPSNISTIWTEPSPKVEMCYLLMVLKLDGRSEIVAHESIYTKTYPGVLALCHGENTNDAEHQAEIKTKLYGTVRFDQILL